MHDKLLEIKIRRVIYELIVKNPGLHASKITEILGMQSQLVDYHLIQLEQAELITSSKNEGFRRFYGKDTLGTWDRTCLAFLRQRKPLMILTYLLMYPSVSFTEILTACDFGKPTLAYHLKKLVKHQIVEVVYVGEEKRYAVVKKKELYRLLIRYQLFSPIDGVKDTWMTIQWPEEKKKP